MDQTICFRYKMNFIYKLLNVCFIQITAIFSSLSIKNQFLFFPYPTTSKWNKIHQSGKKLTRVIRNQGHNKVWKKYNKLRKKKIIKVLYKKVEMRSRWTLLINWKSAISKIRRVLLIYRNKILVKIWLASMKKMIKSPNQKESIKREKNRSTQKPKQPSRTNRLQTENRRTNGRQQIRLQNNKLKNRLQH